MHCFFDQYDPQVAYSHRQMVTLLKTRQYPLSLLALASGQKRCALGLDFFEYDVADGSVPVFLLGEADIAALATVEGSKINKAYRASLVGKFFLVTYTTPTRRGWFRLPFDLGQEGTHGHVVYPPTSPSSPSPS